MEESDEPSDLPVTKGHQYLIDQSFANGTQSRGCPRLLKRDDLDNSDGLVRSSFRVIVEFDLKNRKARVLDGDTMLTSADFSNSPPGQVPSLPRFGASPRAKSGEQ